MDPKDLKNCLKNARDAIGKKDFKEALKQCKLVLTQEKNNYNALVFVGVAAEGLEQTDQALKAYKRAIESIPDKVLAWQGLCGFYEKHQDNSEYCADLVSVYEKLQEFYSSEKDKLLEVQQKLADLHVKVGAVEKAVELYQTLISSAEDTEKTLAYQYELYRLLQKQPQTLQQNEDLLCQTLAKIFESTGPPPAVEGVDEMVRDYLNILMKRGLPVVEACQNLMVRLPSRSYPLEILLISDTEALIGEENPVIEAETEKRFELICELSPDSAVVKLVQGLKKVEEKNWLMARTYLSQVVDQNTKLICGLYFLALVQYRLHMYAEADKQCQRGLKILGRKDRILTMKSSVMTSSLQLLQTWALYRMRSSEAWAAALEIATQLSCQESSLVQGFIKLKLGDLEGAQTQMASSSGDTKLHALCVFLSGCIAVYKKNFYEALNIFLKVIEEDAMCAEYHLMLAKTYWQLLANTEDPKMPEKCFASLLKSAKLDPYNTETFMYLGHFYQEIQKDSAKARKCYQKSFDLNWDNAEAGSAYCDVLCALGEEEEAHTILVSVTKKASAGSGKWAWLRLGLYQMKHESPSVAVSSFQAALRADPHDNHVWECLAEAYLHRGSFTAALKAFTRASELDLDSMYCLFQIASIKQTLGLFSEAVTEYKLILDKSPHYVPALKGLGETHLLMAKSHLKQYFDGRARDNCQDVILYLTRAATHRPDLSCLWKLLGDACSILHPLADENYRLEIPEKLAKKSDKDVSETNYCVLNKQETLELGARCYGRALKLQPDSSTLWHDLGVNYFYQSQHSSVENRLPLAEKALQSLKKAVSLNPNNHRHWTALGVVCCSKDLNKLDLSQHCFIKSIEAEGNNVVAWTNLAVLYLEKNNIELAHEAFKVAQSLEPSYVACWIGQALIAEAIGDEESMDLFRHTTELGHHSEGAMGYASWVCAMIKNDSKHQTEMFKYAIQQMAALPAASDALSRYLDREKTNHTAYNLYGLLLEQQGLYKMAAKAFKSAIVLLEENPRLGDDHFNIASNYTRCQCAAGQFEDALVQFYALDGISKFDDICNFGLSLYKVGKYEESFKAYERAESIASTDAEKSHVHAALGIVAYKFGDTEGAKTSFFKSSQSSVPSVWGLEALCSLGIVRDDNTLAIAAMQELFKHENTEGHQSNIALLAALVEVLKKNSVAAAKSHIQKLIHKDPTQKGLWEVLGKVLIRFSPDDGNAAANCAKCALALGCKTKMVMSMITSGQLAAGQHLSKVTDNNPLSSAQRAVHIYPDDIENVCNLVAALHGEGVSLGSERGVALCSVAVSYTEYISQCETSLGIRLWNLKQRVVSLIVSDQLEEAAHVIQQMTDLSCEERSEDVSQFADIMNNVIIGKPSGIAIKVTQGANALYYWQILIEQYIRSGMHMEVEAALKACLQFGYSDSARQLHFISLIQIAHFSFIEMQKGEGDLSHLKSLFEEAVAEIQKIDSHCTAIKLMQGVLILKENPKLSKRYANQVLGEMEVSPSWGYDCSVAKCVLLQILLDSNKDPGAVEIILEEAKENGDDIVLNFYKQLSNSNT